MSLRKAGVCVCVCVTEKVGRAYRIHFYVFQRIEDRPCKTRDNYSVPPCVFVSVAPRAQFLWCLQCSVAICCLIDGKVFHWQLWPDSRVSSNLQQTEALLNKVSEPMFGWGNLTDVRTFCHKCQECFFFFAGNMGQHKRFKEKKSVSWFLEALFLQSYKK